MVKLSEPERTFFKTLYNSIMKRFLPGLSFFLILVCAACGGSRSTGNETASATSDAARPASVAAPTPIQSLPKIVAFGDSLTAGLGLSAAESYPAVLQEMLRADGYNYEVVNAGVSGDTSAGGVRRIDWSLDGDVRVVILELGANDLLRGQPVSEMKKNLSAIIERIKARDAKILLAGMDTLTSAGPDYRREIRDAFQSLAREHEVPMIPFFLEGVGGIASLNQQDGVHPNVEGSRVVATTVYRYLRPLLDQDKQRAAK